MFAASPSSPSCHVCYKPPASFLFYIPRFLDAIQTKRLSFCAPRSNISGSTEDKETEAERKMKSKDHDMPGVSRLHYTYSKLTYLWFLKGLERYPDNVSNFTQFQRWNSFISCRVENDHCLFLSNEVIKWWPHTSIFPTNVTREAVYLPTVGGNVLWRSFLEISAFVVAKSSGSAVSYFWIKQFQFFNAFLQRC